MRSTSIAIAFLTVIFAGISSVSCKPKIKRKAGKEGRFFAGSWQGSCMQSGISGQTVFHLSRYHFSEKDSSFSIEKSQYSDGACDKKLSTETTTGRLELSADPEDKSTKHATLKATDYSFAIHDEDVLNAFRQNKVHDKDWKLNEKESIPDKVLPSGLKLTDSTFHSQIRFSGSDTLMFKQPSSDEGNLKLGQYIQLEKIL